MGRMDIDNQHSLLKLFNEYHNGVFWGSRTLRGLYIMPL